MLDKGKIAKSIKYTWHAARFVRIMRTWHNVLDVLS